MIEVYLGKRVTLPAYDGGKRDRIVIINTGNSASLIRACQTPSVARGVALSDDGGTDTFSQRFVLSGHTSNAFMGKKMTFAGWARAASDGATSRCLFSIIDGTKYFRVITTGTYLGAIWVITWRSSPMTALAWCSTCAFLGHAASCIM